MMPPTLNFNRSLSNFRCDKDQSGLSRPFSRVNTVSSDSNESDFSALCSHFASVNDLRLQDIAVKDSSAVSPFANPYHPSSSTPQYEYISNKNVIVSTQLLDGQGYSSSDGSAVSSRLIKGFLEDPCVWESEKKTWKRSMGRMRNPQPYIAGPKDLPVISRHEYIPDSLCPNYMSVTPESGMLHFGVREHVSGKRANVNGASVSNKLMGLDSTYELSLSTKRGITIDSAGNGHVMNSNKFSMSSRSPVDKYDTEDDVSCPGSDNESSETDDYASDEDFSFSEPSSWLMNVISMSMQYF